MLIAAPNVRIPPDELRFSFVRSSGPGGQNVNKVNTKAVLRWQARFSPSVSGEVRGRFLQRYARRITGEGEIIITSQRFRDQRQNQRDCLEKFRLMLAAVAVPQKPRKKTKPTRASIRQRHTEKRMQSQRKQQRRRPNLEE